MQSKPSIHSLKGLFLFILTIIVAGCAVGPPKIETTTRTTIPAAITPTEIPIRDAPTRQPTGTLTIVPSPTATELAIPTSTSSPSPTPQPNIRFAVIGDYGLAGPNLQAVSQMVLSWEPDFIITTGDNNYPNGDSETIDDNIGQYFASYIYPYQGSYGNGAETNRFFPSLGNHDLTINNGEAYYEYFTLPGNERYYDFSWDYLHFFVANSDSREPDGVGRSSVQAQWFKDRISASKSQWQILYAHDPPYSSGYHGGTDWMVWPFKEWGVDVVIAGHEHDYERLEIEGMPYFVIGLSGGPIYPFLTTHPGSMARYNSNYGAMLVEAETEKITFAFYAVPGELIDSYTLFRGE